MKKILFLLLMVFLPLMSFCQTSVYQKYKVVAIDSNINTPRYLVGVMDNKEDTIGIVLTIKQAQKIDNDLELLSLYRHMNKNCDSTVNYLIQVVDDYKKLNVVAQAKFHTYETAIADQKKEIDNLNQQILVKAGEIAIKDNIIGKKDDVIKADKFQIKHLKTQRDISIVAGVILSGTLLFMLMTR